jgi:hypothetical protein
MRFWDTLHQVRRVSGIPFIRYDVFLEYPSSGRTCFWNTLHQVRRVSGIPFIRYDVFLDYPLSGTTCFWNTLHHVRRVMKGIPETRRT